LEGYLAEPKLDNAAANNCDDVSVAGMFSQERGIWTPPKKAAASFASLKAYINATACNTEKAVIAFAMLKTAERIQLIGWGIHPCASGSIR